MPRTDDSEYTKEVNMNILAKYAEYIYLTEPAYQDELPVVYLPNSEGVA